tara:strand:+ start:2908 stop:3108 length:201 start_codon:yes stop_codon:yes gene_type:complete
MTTKTIVQCDECSEECSNPIRYEITYPRTGDQTDICGPACAVKYISRLMDDKQADFVFSTVGGVGI